MKELLLSTLFASIIFLVIDIIWLSYSVKAFYRPNLGNLLNDQPIIWAAVLFYLMYVAGLAIIVIYPSLQLDSFFHAFWTGLVFGCVAYGTYNLTNMATIKGWSSSVVIVDMIWGSFLTGGSASLGIYLSKKILS